MKNDKNRDDYACARMCVCALGAINFPIVFSLLEMIFAAFQILVLNCPIFYVIQLWFL